MELIVAALLARTNDAARFCPLAPSPILYQETVSESLGKSGRFNVPNSVQVASRLVDTRTNQTIGWLYLDEHANQYVALKPYVDRSLYAAFHMPGNNMHKPSYPTEAIAQVPSAKIPNGIEVQSCTLLNTA